MLHIGDKVCNVRRPDKIGTVVSLEAPNNKWVTRRHARHGQVSTTKQEIKWCLETRNH